MHSVTEVLYHLFPKNMFVRNQDMEFDQDFDLP